MAEFIIRFAGPSDAEAIADISRSTFYDTFDAHNTKENMDLFMTEQFSRAQLINEVDAANNIFLVACIGEDDDADRKAIEISRIYVVKQSKGHGIGKALLEKCMETATEMNKEQIWLGVWEHNLHAINFYKKAGFEKYGEHIFMLGNDAQTDWLMKKQLK
jgi:GNAT superfamily N-acetyltransferase